MDSILFSRNHLYMLARIIFSRFSFPQCAD